MAMYGRVDYWDERYKATQENGPYEWYKQSYPTLKHLLMPDFLKASSNTASASSQATKAAAAAEPAAPPMLAPTNRSNTEEAHKRYQYRKAAPSQPSSPQGANKHAALDKQTCRILFLGCGNSTFAEDMIHDGWTGEITNVDFSEVVIEQMKHKYNRANAKYHQHKKQHDGHNSKSGNGNRSSNNNKENNNKTRKSKTTQSNKGNKKLPPSLFNMKFVCADVTQRLPFPDGSFDLIICKGTMDAVLCSIGSVVSARHMVAECHRLLSDHLGVFFLVTHGNPDSRVVFLEHGNDISHYWKELSTHRVNREGQTKADYIYICRKQPHAAPDVSATPQNGADPEQS